jgi:hypothetical protein
MESTASTASMATSAALSEATTSEAKLGSPGVSSILIFFFFHSKGKIAELMVIDRLTSSGSKSKFDEPSVTLPSRSTVPETKSMASHKVVLPDPAWETTATLRTSSVLYCFIGTPCEAGGRGNPTPYLDW